MLYAIVAVLVILADQMIKLYVSASGFRAMSLIPGVLNMTKVENTGGAFGLLGGEIPTYWFIVIAGVFTVLVVIALSTKFVKGFLARWSLVLVTAGGISNCIDRVINVYPTGHVVDMFQFDFWQKFPVFNLADVFISVFCIVFIFAILFGRDPKDRVEDEFTEDEEEEEEAPVKPARSSRKARQSRYDEEYEQYKAAQRAREEAARKAAAEEPLPDAVVENPAYNPEDPFAEWERANAAKKPAAPAAEEPAKPVRPARYSDLEAAPVAEETPAPAPAPRPARKPAPAPVVEEDTDFSLDDILAEFK